MLLSCTDNPSSPRAVPSKAPRAAVALPAVRFSEIHYDNSGTDAGEAIEITGPAGMDVTGWQIVLYNGNGGAIYNTKTLNGTIPATCTTRGVIVDRLPGQRHSERQPRRHGARRRRRTASSSFSHTKERSPQRTVRRTD